MVSLNLCGEGSADFGSEGGNNEGPLTVLVRKLYEEHTDSELPGGVVHPLKMTNLRTREKATERIGRSMSYAPRSISPLTEKAALFANIYLSEPDAFGIFHSDVDFTHSSPCPPDKRWQCIYEAINKGLSRGGAGSRACAMVPMPRTEAWLLHMAPECKRSAASLEKSSGNDASPAALKKELDQLGYKPDSHCHTRGRSFSELVENNYNRKKMRELRSYKQFEEDFIPLMDSIRSLL